MSRKPLTVGITGAIGSGKSVVCRLFAMLGVPVYDSDSHARALMNSDASLIGALRRRFGEGCFRDGALDRKSLAAQVFGDGSALADLNAIVHPAVTRDFVAWAGGQQAPYVIVESAILYESGLNRAVDCVVAVTAPTEVRIGRAVLRDGSSPDSVRERMQHQMSDEALAAAADHVILNDGSTMLWHQVLELDAVFRRGAECGTYVRNAGDAARNAGSAGDAEDAEAPARTADAAAPEKNQKECSTKSL